jgi:hypothetical protein
LNGADDRREVFELADTVRDTLMASSAALIYSNHLTWSGPKSPSLKAESAGAALGLCNNEPFAGEPCAAFCSAVLIDDDLVLTAGHCLGSTPAQATEVCQSLQVVFGYAVVAKNQMPTIVGDQVFSCRKVVLLDPDFAIFQLDRPAPAPLAPARAAMSTVRSGDRLVVASYTAGLPLKVELEATVTSASPRGSFVLASDTFLGSSGGGLFTQSLELAGLFERGEPDWVNLGGCSRARQSTTPSEEGQSVLPVYDSLCARGWQSERLCGLQPVCGDRPCSAACPNDCPLPRCGDLLCEPPERAICAEDCSRYDDVPISWLGDPASYPPDTLGSSKPVVSAASGGCAISNERPAAAAAAWCLVLVAPALRWRRRLRTGKLRIRERLTQSVRRRLRARRPDLAGLTNIATLAGCRKRGRLS